MEIFSDEQLQELARKHKTTFTHVRWLAVQLRGLANDVANLADEIISDTIAKERERGQHHTAAVLWLIRAAKQQGLGDYETADLLIAIVDPWTLDKSTPLVSDDKKPIHRHRRAARTHPDRDVFFRPLVEQDWFAIRTAIEDKKMSRRGRALLTALYYRNNESCSVAEFCNGRYGVVAQANRLLRNYGETGYYLRNTDNKSWGKTSVQLWVRRSKE